MIRLALLIAGALFLHGCTTTPLSAGAKVGEERFQNTLKSEELSGKMSLGLKEVEPPEDMGVTDDDIDPSMAIWKAAQHSKGRKHLVPEVDEDDLHHPPLLRDPEARADAAPPEAFFRNDPPNLPYRQAEVDLDDEFHGFPGSQAHEDKDETYHRYQPDQPRAEQGQPRRLVYTQPEEDQDGMYHRDVPNQRIYPQPQIQPAPLSFMAEPEEDRDHLYHN